MRIGVVCPYDLGSPGGVQVLCRDLAEGLRRGGDAVVLAGPGQGDDWQSLGSVVAVTANGSRVPFTMSPGAGRRIRRVLGDVDLLHLHEPLIPLVGWAALRTELPTVVTFHADPPRWARALYRSLGPMLTSTFARKAVTAVSEVAAGSIPSEWGPVETIPNAIDVASFDLDVPRKPKRVAFLGRDDPRKGLEVILAAWPEVLARHPDADLTVIGTSRPDPIPGVRFVGRVDETDKRSLLASSEVFVAPNLGGESFGIVIAEAMAAGCAVLASDIDAFRPVAGEAATYVPPGSSHEWARQMISLLGSPERISAQSRAGRREVARFDWGEVLSRYRSAYQRVLNPD